MASDRFKLDYNTTGKQESAGPRRGLIFTRNENVSLRRWISHLSLRRLTIAWTSAGNDLTCTWGVSPKIHPAVVVSLKEAVTRTKSVAQGNKSALYVVLFLLNKLKVPKTRKSWKQVRVFPCVPLNWPHYFWSETKKKTRSTMNPHKYISWYSGIRQHSQSEVID